MNTTTPEKCPKCGAGAKLIALDSTYYTCKTRIIDNGEVIQTPMCIRTQRDQLAERVKGVKRLEEIGDLMAAELNRQCAPHWEDALARMWRLERGKGRHVDQAEVAACAVIQDERREG